MDGGASLRNLKSPTGGRVCQQRLSIVYDYVALHAYTIIRVVLFCVAATFWVLYIHEVLFRSGRIRTQWLKKGLADFLLLLCIAIFTFLVLTLMSGGPPAHHRAR